MPIDFGWHDEAKRIWLVKYDNQWTIDEFWQMIDATYAMLDALAPQSVYLISLIPKIFNMPKGALTAFQSASKHTRPNQRLHVVVGGSTIINRLYDLYQTSRSKGSMRMANSFEEALALIERTIAEDAALRQSQS